jgi:hypothetical protein
VTKPSPALRANIVGHPTSFFHSLEHFIGVRNKWPVHTIMQDIADGILFAPAQFRGVFQQGVNDQFLIVRRQILNLIEHVGD